MIAVIADDITGAAEIAGIGFEYGLKVVLTIGVEADIPTCDLLVCITNTRSMTQDKAISESLYIGKALTEKGINHIFKKTDSVLRGHVAAELKALMKVTGKTQTLLLPANPSLGRQIIGGKYYINDIPIMETAFSYDPEFPAKSNEVLALLGEGQLVNATESISTTITNILIGNVSKEEELEAYCQKLTAEILPAGGSSYFKAYLTWLLEVNSIESISSKLQLDKLLLICGSTIKHNALLEELKQANVPIESMPLNVYNGSASPNEWIEFLNKQYALHGNLVVMINHPISSDPAYALRLKRIMAQVCNNLLERQTVKEMIIEGGATAYEVIETMHWNHFKVVNILTSGVIKLQPEGCKELQLTLKPGSYQWPKQVLSR